MRRILPLVLLTSTAAADPAPVEPTYDLGFRVGGYGFRRDGDNNRETQWTECRMDGFGVFGSRALRGPIFVEAGLDLYSSSDFRSEGAENDLPVSRTSGLASAAIGARTNIGSRVRGYVQVGAGLELTHVSVPYGDETIRDDKALPMGFFGFGLDVRITGKMYVGALLRGLVMGNFDYDPARLDRANGWVMAPSAGEVFDASPDAAALGQFYIRRDL
jgi:hypothetical protein